MNWILNRLKENSTWRGLILLATIAGAHWSPQQQESIITFGLSAIALINVFRNSTTPGGNFNPNAEVKKAQTP